MYKVGQRPIFQLGTSLFLKEGYETLGLARKLDKGRSEMTLYWTLTSLITSKEILGELCGDGQDKMGEFGPARRVDQRVVQDRCVIILLSHIKHSFKN